MPRKPAKTQGPQKQIEPDGSGIRIRMYRVGFGDSFLIDLPTKDGPKYILVDCGVHARGNIHTIQSVVEDISAVTKENLAILIATHAHQDHVSGFGSMESQFSRFKINEVWLPWTENPKDREATSLRKKQLALLGTLRAHFAAAAPNSPAAEAVLNMSGNQRAMDALHSGFGVGAKVRYLEAGLDDLEAPGKINGLIVKVLGPPRDAEFLAKMNPPASQHYLRLDASGRVVSANGVQPFEEKWKVKRGYRRAPVVEDEKALIENTTAPLSDLAFALDQAVNNTSVVVLFEYRGHNLLFAGDAQYGNWKFWLEQANSDDILRQVDFYKVAHHGSVNATPKSALEKMGDGNLAAMVSTQDVPWPSIPEKKLMQALDKRTGHEVVRSDSLAIAGVTDAPRGPRMKKLPSHFSAGPLFYEYVIT